MSEKAISSTTQEFLDVYDIVNDMVLLKDGTASIILQVGTMNFSLLAEQEQDAIIFTYGSLLNSLNYPIQISIQSQTKDVTKYLRLLDEQVQKASSDRKAVLIKQYRNFVAALIKERNVLEKHFYITVPAGPAEMGLITPSSVLPGKAAFDITTIEKSIILEKAANILEPRRDHLSAQFNRLGLYTRQLNTQEIIQNFYINYNPEAAEGQEISNNENYTTPLVRASFGGKIMQTNNSTQNPTPEEILRNDSTIKQAPAQETESTQVEPAQAEPTQAEPALVEPTQTESLQTEPTQAEPTLTEVPVTQPMQAAPGINYAEPAEPTISEPLEFAQTEPVQSNTVPAPEKNDITASANLDLNLDPNLINNDQPEQTPIFDPNQKMDDPMSNVQVETPIATNVSAPTPTPALDSTPAPTPISTEPTTVAEPAVAAEQEITAESTSVIEPVTSVKSPTETQNNFTEEITPLQSKFEQPIANKTNSISEENKTAQPQT